MDIPELIKRIHGSGWKGVMAIAGGGAGAIDILLNRGGGSAFLLEATVPYAQESFATYIGKPPEKFVSQTAARQLAMASYLRARKYVGEDKPVVGLGASCALAKAGPERKDREHRICIAFQTRFETVSASFKLPHLGREHEESFAAHLIIRMLGDGVQVTERNWLECEGYDGTLLESIEESKATYEAMSLLHGKSSFAYHGDVIPVNHRRLMFPGSFNPLHDGHREIAQIASEHLKEEVMYEISVHNADKPPIDYIDMKKRAAQFQNNLVMTNAPLMIEKARLFPNTTFICGVDSWERIIDPKYYGNDTNKLIDAMQELKELGVDFMVFPRKVGEEVKSLDPNTTCGLAYAAPKIPVHVDCSSTKLRAEAGIK